MASFLQRLRGRVTNELLRYNQRRTLAPLYAPDADDLDLSRHIEAAMAWLKRAQDAGVDRGVAYGATFGEDFDVSYPETTGYIIQTFVEQESLTGDQDLLARAIEMGDWEISIQMQSGAVMGGKFNSNPVPAVFNTGMVLLGWSSLVRRTGEKRFAVAAERASDWLVSMQEPNGTWIRGNSTFAKSGTTLYNVKAAWGLCETGLALGRQDYVDAAVRNAEYCLARQQPNGWLPDCCLSDADAPLLHTLAYAMQGLWEIGRLTGREDLVLGARRLADAQIGILTPDGFLPGRQREDFSAAVDWCCLTGSAQTSIVLSNLYEQTRDDRYASAARRINRYLMAHHDIRNADLRLCGGLAGAWPTWGDYGRLSVLNWATKFLVDALSRERRFHK